MNVTEGTASISAYSNRSRRDLWGYHNDIGARTSNTDAFEAQVESFRNLHGNSRAWSDKGASEMPGYVVIGSTCGMEDVPIRE